MTAVVRSWSLISRSGGADPPCPIPVGTVNGDCIFAFGVCSNGATITGPGGGLNLHPNSVGNQSPFWGPRIASSEPATYTFVVSGLAASCIVMVSLQAGTFDPSNPFDDVKGVLTAGGTAGIVIPAATSGGTDRLLFQSAARLNASATFTGPIAELWDSLAANQNYGTVGANEIVGSGSTGSRTWTSSSSSNPGVGYMVAIKPATQTLSVTGFAPAVAFGTPTLRQTVSPSGFTPDVDFGTPSLREKVTPSGFAPNVVFGTPTVILDQFLPVTGFAPAVVFGTPGVRQTVTPSGFTPSVVFGTPTLVQDQFVTPDGFEVPVLFGTPTLTPITTLNVTGFAVPVVFGDPTVILDNVLPVTGFQIPVQFGTPSLTTQPVIQATVYNHETGDPAPAGATVQLFTEAGVLVDETVTDADGHYIFLLPFGTTGGFYTVVRFDLSGVDYQGVSSICEPV